MRHQPGLQLTETGKRIPETGKLGNLKRSEFYAARFKHFLTNNCKAGSATAQQGLPGRRMANQIQRPGVSASCHESTIEVSHTAEALRDVHGAMGTMAKATKGGVFYSSCRSSGFGTRVGGKLRFSGGGVCGLIAGRRRAIRKRDGIRKTTSERLREDGSNILAARARLKCQRSSMDSSFSRSHRRRGDKPEGVSCYGRGIRAFRCFEWTGI